MKSYRDNEKSKAGELLSLGESIKVEALNGQCIPYKFLSASDFALNVCTIMLEEYNGQAPKESYEYERHIFWKNVKNIILDFDDLKIQKKEKIMEKLSMSLDRIFELETNLKHLNYSGCSVYSDEYVHWLEDKIIKYLSLV